MIPIRTRHEWGARAPLGPPMRGLPARTLFAHHSVTQVTGNPDADVRTVERIGVSRFGRMSYSYLWHPGRPDVVYEGAGLTTGAHTAGHNSTTLALCAIGNYEADVPPGTYGEAFARLYARLVVEGRLRPDAGIEPHSLVKSTACPGRHIRALLPHIRARAAELVANPTPPPAGGDPFDEELARAMDTIDLRNAHVAPVRGRHVDNLQGLLAAAAAWEPMRPAHPGAIDGVAGDATRRGLLEFQGRAKYLGAYAGAVDGIVGPATWRALVTF